jgi:hypothetical protein
LIIGRYVSVDREFRREKSLRFEIPEVQESRRARVNFSRQIILKWKDMISLKKGTLISVADNRALRSTVDRAYQTPPTFLPLTMGGGPSWWYFPCGTLIRVTFLSTRTPLAHYHLLPNPPSE